MRADSIVTIWHFEEGSDVPQRKIFKGVHTDIVNRISKNGIKQKGFFDGKSATVRIPTCEEIGVLPGDYLSIGENFGQFPETETSLKVIEVKDNRCGGQKHWRILCGG